MTEYRFLSAGWRQPFDSRKATPDDYRIAITFEVGKTGKTAELRLTPDEALVAAMKLIEAYRIAVNHTFGGSR